ncbi:DUF397 domain-containing protein [Streptomyces sp. NBC_01102]|uniref:DUF397 domain-containing protein n=1 Tax=Streptomyces sp. NBC_01102 TaxID=2903749 RepID=UPI0038633006|nr:DUF397 domain-containing protein [Streptomyces sp. NBC_01102]
MVVIPNWHTSSYTGTETCVEVADNDPAGVMVRDSKNRDRAKVGFCPAVWTEFVSFVRRQG